MRERPILFSGPMVRAILDGTKTQTRRIVKPQPERCDHADWPELPTEGPWSRDADGWHCSTCGNGMRLANTTSGVAGIRCPYGQPGDRLWVRETFFEQVDPLTSKPYDPPRACYRATEYGEVICDDGDGFAEINKDGTFKSPWRPSIHMPRWASRITLEIVSVRLERLQDISGADAIAEGVFGPHIDKSWHGNPDYAKGAYRHLWDSINGPGSWAANPFVWVVEFKKV